MHRTAERGGEAGAITDVPIGRSVALLGRGDGPDLPAKLILQCSRKCILHTASWGPALKAVAASHFNPYPARAILGGPCIAGPEGKAAPLTVDGRAPLSTCMEAKAVMVSSECV